MTWAVVMSDGDGHHVLDTDQDPETLIDRAAHWPDVMRRIAPTLMYMLVRVEG